MAQQHPPVRMSGPLPPPLRDSTVFALMQAGRLAAYWSDRRLQPTGVALRDYAALSVIDRLFPLVQAALADRLGMSEVRAAEMVARLKRHGLLDRFYDPRDLRARILRITPAGREAIAPARAALDRVERELLNPLQDDERRQLHDYILRLAPPVPGVARVLRLIG